MPTRKKRPPSRPPKTFDLFSRRFPRLAEAWELLGKAGTDGPLGEKTARLVKLAVSIGARSEGATHSAVRKALGAGAAPEEIYQVVALAASTIGLPGAVAAFTWVEDELGPTRS
jgi:alkylhydroperoxidase/carboxymuconolactone decarboxylase family protein YurZ